VPGDRPPTTAPGPVRHAVLPAVALCALLTAASCGSGTPAATTGGGTSASSPSSSSAPPPSTLPAPWSGALVPVALPTGVQALRAVTCPAVDRCWAVGSTVATGTAGSSATVVTTSDGGASWKVQSVPSGVDYLAGIDCATVRACVAVGQVGTTGTGPGAVLATDDGGSVWTLQPVPAGTTDVTAVTCTTAARCTALGAVSGRVTALTGGGSGAPWATAGSLPPTVASATSVSCTDAVHCWATGIGQVGVGRTAGVVAATADAGTTWALQTVPGAVGALQGIDCATVGSGTTTGRAAPVDCTAVGTTATGIDGARQGQGVVLTTGTGGTTWTSAPVTPTGSDLTAVSCGAGPCVAVGSTVASAPQSGLVVLTRASGVTPGGWRRAVVAPVALPLTGVDCRSAGSCVMVGQSFAARLSGG